MSPITAQILGGLAGLVIGSGSLLIYFFFKDKE